MSIMNPLTLTFNQRADAIKLCLRSAKRLRLAKTLQDTKANKNGLFDVITKTYEDWYWLHKRYFSYNPKTAGLRND